MLVVTCEALVVSLQLTVDDVLTQEGIQHHKTGGQDAAWKFTCNPFNFCKPLPKLHEDRAALLEVSPCFGIVASLRIMSSRRTSQHSRALTCCSRQIFYTFVSTPGCSRRTPSVFPWLRLGTSP